MTEVAIAHRSVGITFLPDGLARVCVWAPKATSLQLIRATDKHIVPLESGPDGYWRTNTPDLSPGDRYWFVLDGQPLPDPASLAQPDGVHGPSAALNTQSFVWTDEGWINPPLDDYLLYELHTGTFSPDGTFAGITERLDHLLDLGINAIEIMPVAQFPGDRNWGYDGVFPFAVQSSYGGAAGLQQLIDACHARGLAVVLDVVYNHVGPEGNYLGAFGPYFTNRYSTPWGDAVNFDGPDSAGVRQFVIENVLMWFRDFHIDALRLDAVHAIRDNSASHLLRDMRLNVDRLMAQTGRQHYLIIESDQNETRFIRPVDAGGYGMDAQWNDEFHHALRVTAGGERHGYYADYDGISHLAKSFRDAYVYDGTYMPRRASIVGSPTTDLPGRQFVVFSQNHDQIGNRMLGERPGQLVSPAMQRLMAGAVLTSSYLPMLFMGEEWGEPNPFLYFVSHTDPALIEAVREGRKREFADFQAPVPPPDPQAEATFQQSKLQWDLRHQEPHHTLFRYYQALLLLRKQSVLRFPNRHNVLVTFSEQSQTLVLERWHERRRVVCLFNFASTPQLVLLPACDAPWQRLFDSGDPIWGGPQAGPALVAGDASVQLPPESMLIYTNQIE
ncbi:malto-oligosyltrehalose trehalohydrolase [Spirosoma luteolum]